MRRVTRSTSPTRSASSSAGERLRRPSARCEPIEPPPRPRAHRPRVAVVRERVQVRARGAAEQRVERGSPVRRPARRPSRCPARVQLARRSPARRPTAARPGSGCRNASSRVGRDDEQPVRLRDRARDLGEELRPRDADRDREPDLARARRARSRAAISRGVPASRSMPAHVEERLVDREPLDERRRVLEDREDRLARLGVGGHARRHDDRVRAEPPRLPAAHRRAHAERLRLVARGEHDAAADDHRPAAQRAGRRAARPTRRTSRGRRGGSSPATRTDVRTESPGRNRDAERSARQPARPADPGALVT